MDNLIEALKTAEWNTLVEGWTMAIDLSSGKYSYKMLAKPVASGGWGHPYGVAPGHIRKSPPPYTRDTFEGSPAKINRQSGKFVSSWKLDDPIVKNDTMTSSLYNDAPYAEDLYEGISGLTMPRRTVDLIGYRLENKRIRNIVEALVATGDLGIQVKY